MAPLLAHRSANRAFERIYRRHVGDVYRYSLAVLRNPADAEDVTQTTFLNAYRAFSRGERPQKPQNWLIAIAHNVCRQRFRQAARRPNEVAFEEELAAAAPESEAPTPDDLSRALGHLAFNQRAALVLRELEGRSYAEIAESLEISVSAVETLLFRARRALREQLEGSLTCVEAELAISRQLDRRLPRAEAGALRAHLRECRDCASLARSQRAQRSAWKALAAVPLPSSLAGLFGGGGGGAVVGAAAGTAGFGVGAKAVAVLTAAAVAGGVGYEGAKHVRFHAAKTRAAAVTPVRARLVPRQTPAASTPVPPRPATASPVPSRATPPAASPKLEPVTHVKPRAKPKPVAHVKQRGKPKPVRARPRGKAVGLARSEQVARKKVKPDRPAVGLARSEQRAKQKAAGPPGRVKKQARPESRPKHAKRGGGGGNGNGNGNGNGRGKHK